MGPVCLETISLLIMMIAGSAISQNLPDENLLFWSIVDGMQSQVQWLPANPQSYKDNKTITVAGRYPGNYRWNAIAVDYYEMNAIMSDSVSNSIYNAHEWFHSEGQAEQTVFGTSGYLVHGIAIDWFSRAFYWIDEGFNWIRLSSYDSTKTALIIGTELDKPQGIAVYPIKGYLFWTDLGQQKIERSSLSGKNRTTIINNLRNPTDITVDATVMDGRIYWIDLTSIYNDNHTIESSNCEGQDRRTEYHLPFLEGTLLEIAVDGDFIFVAIQSPNQGSVIRYIRKDTKATVYELSLEEEVLDISVSGFDVQPWDIYSGVCINADPQCTDFCVYDGDGGYECLCSDKYSLHADGVNCTFDNSVIEPPYLFFTRQNEISFMPVTLVHQGQAVSDGIDTIYTLLSVSESPLALAIDFHDQYVFYSDQVDKSINVVRIGEGEEVLFQRIGQVEGLAVDWLAKNIYWTDCEFNHVVVCSYDSRFTRELFTTDVIKPRSIAIDPYAKLLFWSELGPPGQIESSYLDGSNRHVLNVLLRTDQPSGLALDLNKHRVYFANRMDGSINYMNYDGSNLNILYIHPDGYLNFFDLTLYQDFIMWTESNGERNGIYVVYNENESGIDGSLPDSLQTVYAIETYDESVQPAGSSLCDQEGNNGCSRLCLTSLLNETSCACSDGFVLDDNDYTQCVSALSIMQDDFYLIADQEKHSIFQMNANEPFKYTGLNIGVVGDPVAIAYDPIERRMYWVDAEFSVIRRSSLDGTNVEDVIKDENIVSPMGVAVDYITRLMFWTDSALRKIEVSYLDGTVRFSLIDTEDEEPRDIVVDPIGRRIFWSVQGNNPAIRTAYMDGNSKRKLETSGLIIEPSGLVIHFEEGRLYWCNENNGTIESINLDGTGSKVYIELQSSSQPNSLTLRFDDVVWSDYLENSLRHIDSETGDEKNVDDNHFGKMSSIHYHASISSLQVSDAEGNGCLDENGGCSHICLPSKVAGQVECKCNGDIPLSSDSKQCQTELLCTKTFLGGGVDNSCIRSVNTTCEIYCIPQFKRSNVTTNITCNEFGKWDQDTSLLCIRSPDPIWINTPAPQTTLESSTSEAFSDVYIMWILFGIAAMCLILVVIVINNIILRSPKTRSAVNMTGRPLPDPDPYNTYYEDPDYAKINIVTKKDPEYDTRIDSDSAEVDEQLEIQSEVPVATSAVVDGYSTRTSIDAENSVRSSVATSAVVDGYSTRTSIDAENSVRSSLATSAAADGYLIITSIDAENSVRSSVATSAVVDGYSTRTSIDAENSVRSSLATSAAADGYLIITSNDAENPAFVDDYETQVKIQDPENGLSSERAVETPYHLSLH